MIRLRIMYVVLTLGLLVLGASGLFTGLRYRAVQSMSYANFAQQKPAGWYQITGAGYDLAEGSVYMKNKRVESLYVPLRGADELGRGEDRLPIHAFLVIRPERSKAIVDLYEQLGQLSKGNDTKQILSFLQTYKNRVLVKSAFFGMTSQSLEMGSEIAETTKLRGEYPLMTADVAFFELDKTPTLAGPAAMLLSGLFLSWLGIRSVRSDRQKKARAAAPNSTAPGSFGDSGASQNTTAQTPLISSPTASLPKKSPPDNSNPWS